MEHLHNMLVEYNLTLHKGNCPSWSSQFLEPNFPKYWQMVYSLLDGIDRNLRVVEIGCGQGDITSILCYLNFTSVVAYERDNQLALIAEDKVNKLFGKTGIVRPNEFNANTKEKADILILVNCVYVDSISSKNEYLNRIYSWYAAANSPKYLILEFIDDSYKEEDNAFPECVRVNSKDIQRLFPMANIDVYQTYQFPLNKKSKNLYFITNPS